MKQFIAFLIFNSVCTFNSIAQDYLCIPSAAVGFYFNTSTKKWERTFFNINDEKKILKKTLNGYEWRNFGSTTGPLCEGFNEYDYLNCRLYFGNLKLNKKTLRYIETYTIGYLDGEENNNNTPNLQIGTCTPL